MPKYSKGKTASISSSPSAPSSVVRSPAAGTAGSPCHIHQQGGESGWDAWQHGEPIPGAAKSTSGTWKAAGTQPAAACSPFKTW